MVFHIYPPLVFCQPLYSLLLVWQGIWVGSAAVNLGTSQSWRNLVQQKNIYGHKLCL